MARRDLVTPPPLEGNDELITAVITAGWLIALVVLLILRGHLAPDQRWWFWVTVAGSALGVFGLWYVPWLKRSRSRAAARHEARRAERGQAELSQAGRDPAQRGQAGRDQESRPASSDAP